jgi:hypothetical protein
MKKIIVLLTFCLSFIFGYSQKNLITNADRQIIIAPNKGMESAAEAFIKGNSAIIVTKLDQLGWYIIELPSNTTQDKFISNCKGRNFIKNVWKDETVVMDRDYIPNDTEFGSCWHLRQLNDIDIDADEAWDLLPTNNPFVTVAVFDGGLDLTHPDLIGNTDSPYDAVFNTNTSNYVNSYDRHGTACSGTIAAITNNSLGVSSVGNNKVKVMPVNIMTSTFSSGSFTTSTTVQLNAINAAMANPNCVAISMSYGGVAYSSAVEAAFQSARTTARNGKGMVVFASTGNNGISTASQYPAQYTNVWGVGATTSGDFRASFSNYGSICDISGPGSGIRTIDRVGVDGYNSTNYTTISGTSFSCPIVAAAAALCFYKNWELTDDQVLQIISQTCQKVGGYAYSSVTGYTYGTRSNELGYGRINLKDAINATPSPGGILPPPPPPPTVTYHNLSITNLVLSPTQVNINGTLVINCNQSTNDPTLSAVTSILQYRSSTNTTWGDSDDVIIGTDTTTLGGGVSTGPESISFNVGNVVGSKYILIRANYNGSIIETNNNDNTATGLYSVINNNVAGTDVAVTYDLPTTSVVNLPSTSTSFNFRIKVTNTGSVNVTNLTIGYGWINFGQGTYSWSGTLTPGQFVLLPSSNGYWGTPLCFSTSNCAVPAGSSNTHRARLVSVNGSTIDSNSNNDVSTVLVNRLSTATTNDINYIEVRSSNKLYENPIRYNSLDEIELEKGLNFIHIYYKDGIVKVDKLWKE